MSLVRFIDTKQRIVVTKLGGSFVAQDTIAAQQSLKDNPEFAPDFRALFDYRGITKMELTSSELHEIVKSSPFDGSGRRAVVAGRDDTSGVKETYQSYQAEHDATFRLFEDLEEAREWLGLD